MSKSVVLPDDIYEKAQAKDASELGLTTSLTLAFTKCVR